MGKAIRSISHYWRLWLVAIGVPCGPGLVLMSIACVYTAWLIGNDGAKILAFLWASVVCASWALYGITSGPRRLWSWWFGLAALLNMFGGVAQLNSHLPNHYFVGSVFLGYSLWQAIICFRPAPERLP